MGQRLQQGYWVIWYPSYTHKDFQIIDKVGDQPIIEDLTDSYFSDTHTYLKINTDHSRKPNEKENIRLSFHEIVKKKNTFFKILLCLYRNNLIKDRPVSIQSIDSTLLNESNLVSEIELIYKKHSSNGLFVYECFIDKDTEHFTSEDGFTLPLDKDQYPTFYNIKQLYHTHLFHSKSKEYKDYYFRAYLTPDEPNITEANNESLRFFIEKFLEYFELQLKHFEEIKTNSNAAINERKRQIDKSIAILEEYMAIANTNKDAELSYLEEIYKNEIKRRKREKESLIILSKNKKDKENLFVACNDIVGETLFTNTLCCSKYLNKKDDKIRKLLINIENVNKGLQYVRDNYRYWYDEQVSTKSIKQTIFFGRAGIVFGIISLIFTIYTYYNPNKFNQTNNERKNVNQNIVVLQENTELNKNNNINPK